MTSLDLYGYTLVTGRLSYQKYLRLIGGYRFYQFTALTCIMATVPPQFTKVAKEVKLMARAEGISIRQYIEGWLMRMNSKQQCLVHLVEAWVGSQISRIRVISNFSNQFSVTIRPQGRSSLRNSKKIDWKTVESSHLSPWKLRSLWKHGFNGEDYTIGRSAHEGTPMVFGNTAYILSFWLSHFLFLWFTGVIFSGRPIIQFWRRTHHSFGRSSVSLLSQKLP